MYADEEARISGFDIDALIDGGGFASFGHVTSYYNGVLATAPYELGSFHYTGARVWTNKPASGAMRGHGAVNTRTAVEVGLDDMSEQLQVDPIDLRLANYSSSFQDDFRIQNHLKWNATSASRGKERK